MRARNIKPGFFTDEELVECQPLVRILFAGLWCAADRDGRLKDNPKRLKIEVLPCDDCDVDSLLDELAEHGMIVRYEANGGRYIQVVNFVEHQNPHPKEKSMGYPGPQRQVVELNDQPCNYKTGRADLLNPESLNPDSSSLPHPSGSEESVAEGPATPACPHQKIIELYHKTLPELRQVKAWNAERERWLKARWREDPERQSLEWWSRFFEYVRGSPFLMGQAKDTFQADLAWIIRPRNFASVLEGKYHDRQGMKVWSQKTRKNISAAEEWLRTKGEEDGGR